MADFAMEPFGIPEDEEDTEEEKEEQSEQSQLTDLDDVFDLEEFKIRTGPLMPRSAPNLEGLSETAIQKILEGMSDEDIEDLFNKNTESFRCLAQALISRSSLMRHILYHFPELEDPGIDEAFSYVEPEPLFDDIGAGKYRQLCKEMNIAPITRVIHSLNTDTLNLKYYGLSDKQFKAIASCVMLNTHIKTLILGDNWISPEAALWLCEMLRENNSIKVLNLRECRLGSQGLANCAEGFALNQSLREIDLSYNDLGDEGIEILVAALKDNYNVDKLNLGHNNLGELSGKRLGELLKEHTNIDYLDLSWNDLYSGKAMAYLISGIMESDGLEYLNLSWNGIGTAEHLGPILKYLKTSKTLQHLDLSFNRIMGKIIGMLIAGLKDNQSLNSINLGFNPITPADAVKLISVMNEEQPLQYMDLQNIFVNKNFLPVWKKLSDMGKSIRVEGVIQNYQIEGPDRKKVVFERCRYLAQKPKKKKLQKDFGSDFIWGLPDQVVDNATFTKMVKKSKIKLDADLIDYLGDMFSRKKKKIELKLLRDTYLEMYPNTQPPVIPEKKGKDKKKTLKIVTSIESNKDRPSTEEKAIGTESLQMSSMQNISSLVTPKIISGSQALSALSKIQQQQEELSEPEKVVSTIDLDEENTNVRSAAIKSFVSMRGLQPSGLVVGKMKPVLRHSLQQMSRIDSIDLKNRTKSIAFRLSSNSEDSEPQK